MKKILNKLKQKLMPKVGKKNTAKNKQLPPLLLPMVEANQARQQQLDQCKQTFAVVIKKLKNKEPLSVYDYRRTKAAINALTAGG